MARKIVYAEIKLHFKAKALKFVHEEQLTVIHDSVIRGAMLFQEYPHE